MKIKGFAGIILFVSTLLIVGCKSKIDKAIENIAPYEKYFMGDVIKVDSLPVGFEKKLADFAKEFKQYSKSSKYIYAAAFLAEKRGRLKKPLNIQPFMLMIIRTKKVTEWKVQWWLLIILKRLKNTS